MDIPFGARVLLLVFIASVLSGIDFRKNGAQSTAYREYSFIFLTGVLGSLIGGTNDAITSSISPEYFVIGKGLAEGTRLRFHAIDYGIQVGFSGGVISGAILIYTSRRKSTTPPITFGFLLRRLWIPMTGAVLGGLILPCLASKLDPFHLATQAQTVLASDRIPDFLLVWWIHAGLYTGLLAGLCLLLALGARRRLARK